AAGIGLKLEVALLRERPQDRVVDVPRGVARVRVDAIDPDTRAWDRGVLRRPVLRGAVRKQDVDGVGVEPSSGQLTGLVDSLGASCGWTGQGTNQRNCEDDSPQLHCGPHSSPPAGDLHPDSWGNYGGFLSSRHDPRNGH